jgi:FixJ family two-component response regulator
LWGGPARRKSPRTLAREPVWETLQVRVHIIEDDPGVADSLLLVLEQMGHFVTAHMDAESFFQDGVPSSDDVVLVDLALPGIGGSRLIHWLQRLVNAPRVIAMTGKPRFAIDGDVSGLHDVQILQKPISTDVLSAVLVP